MYKLNSIFIKFIVALFLLITQVTYSQTTYSRWNYSKDIPNNTKLDTKLVDDIVFLMNNHLMGTGRIYIRYSYNDTDSSFTTYGAKDGIPVVYTFDPVFPDQVKELERSNEVIILVRYELRDRAFAKKDVSTKVKKSIMVGKDEMVSDKYRLNKIPEPVLLEARKTVKLIDKNVKAIMSDGKTWYTKPDKKLTESEKRKAALRVATKKDKDSDYIKKDK